MSFEHELSVPELRGGQQTMMAEATLLEAHRPRHYARPLSRAALTMALSAGLMVFGHEVAESTEEPGVPNVENILIQAQNPEAPQQVAASQTKGKGLLQIFVSPKGKDANTGLTPATPIQTVEQAQKILKSRGIKGTDVQIRFEADQGSYRHQGEIKWNVIADIGRTITFMSADKGQRARFVGNGTMDNFMEVTNKEGGRTGLRFHNLHVEKYRGSGFSLQGGETDVHTAYGHPVRRPTEQSVDGVVFDGVHIEDIGNKPNKVKGKDKIGYAAIIVKNANYTKIVNSYFKNIANRGDESQLSHGLYFNMSRYGLVKGNTFKKIPGSGIKTRNISNELKVQDNVFIGVGTHEVIEDTFQEGSERSLDGAGNQRGDECASWNVMFLDNKIGYAHNGRKSITLVSLSGGGNKYPGKNQACPPADGRRRVILDDNDRIKKAA